MKIDKMFIVFEVAYDYFVLLAHDVVVVARQVLICLFKKKSFDKKTIFSIITITVNLRCCFWIRFV